MAFKYTEVEFEDIKQQYSQGKSLETIQAVYPDKSVASIRMKLIKAGLYNKLPQATKRTSTSTTATATKVVQPSVAFPTTKAGIRAVNQAAYDLAGPALF